jgi:hypothetical protein
MGSRPEDDRRCPTCQPPDWSLSYLIPLRCHGRGRAFESRRPRHSFQKRYATFAEISLCLFFGASYVTCVSCPAKRDPPFAPEQETSDTTATCAAWFAGATDCASAYTSEIFVASPHVCGGLEPDHCRGRSISTTSERSCIRSNTTSPPSDEMSKSRTSKSAGRLVNCRSAPVSRSISQRFLC